MGVTPALFSLSDITPGGQTIPYLINPCLQRVGIPRILYDNVCSSQPCFSGRLGRHAPTGVFLIHAAEPQPLHPGSSICVDNQPDPAGAHEIGQKWHLNDQNLFGRLFHPPGNLAANRGMGEPFEPLEFGLAPKDNVGQAGAVYDSIDNHRGPGRENACVGFALSLEHLVTNTIRVDHQRPASTQQLANGALPGADSAGEQNSNLPV